MADLLVDRHVRVDPSCGRFAGIMEVFCEPQQHADGELVVQKAAFDVAGRSDPRARLEADDVSNFGPKRACLLRRLHILVEHGLNRVKRALGLAVFAVHMHRGVAQLHRTLDDLSGSCVDADIFRLRIFCAQAAKGREL